MTGSLALSFVLLLCCILGVPQGFVTAELSPNSKVIEVTTDTFNDFIKSNELVLLEFYTPSCRFCQNFEPVYDEIAEELSTSTPPVAVGRIDAMKEQAVTIEYGVEELPGIVVFKFGEIFRFKGFNRSKEKVLEFARSHTSPVFTMINTQKDFDKWTGRQLCTSVLIYLDKSSPNYQRDFETASRVGTRLNNEHDFALTHNRELMDQFNCPDIDSKKKPCVVDVLPAVYKSKNEQLYRANKFDNKEDLTSFISRARIPLVGELFGSTMEWYKLVAKGDSLPWFTVYHKLDFKRDPKKSNYVANRVRKIAKDYVGRALFVVADTVLWSNDLDNDFALLPEEAVGAVTARTPAGYKYLFTGLTGQVDTFSTDGLREWVESVLSETAEPFLKSEEPAENPVNEKGVTHLTRKSFESLVRLSGVPSLIFFHAPWNSECKKFKPIFEQIATTFKSVPVQLAMFDLTLNEKPTGFEVETIPTLYFVSAAGVPELYNGERTPETITQFLDARGILVPE